MTYVVKTEKYEVHAPNIADLEKLLTTLQSTYGETRYEAAASHLGIQIPGLDQPADSKAIQSQSDNDRAGSEISTGEWLSRAAAEARAQGPDAAAWSFTGIWNKSLEEPEPREYTERGYLWASELGKPMVDNYLKMKGVQPTNPPNPRSLRKFEAGNAWEWIVKLVLIRANILVSAQERVRCGYDNMLEVSGKMDFVAGGQVDLNSVNEKIDALELPESFIRATKRIAEHLAERGKLVTKPIEIKSLSSFMFEALERSQRALKQHRLQLFHYLKGTGYPVGDIVYICRDDCRMMEFQVRLNDQAVENEYKAYIEAMSEYYFKDEIPPLEELIVFDKDMLRFSKNNGVAWSPYLTKLYGIADQAEFDEKYQKTPERWNRVLARLKKAQARDAWLADLGATVADIKKEKAEGKKTATIPYVLYGPAELKVYLPNEIKSGCEITAKNEVVIQEIRDAGFDLEKILEISTVTADEATEE